MQLCDCFSLLSSFASFHKHNGPNARMIFQAEHKNPVCTFRRLLTLSSEAFECWPNPRYLGKGGKLRLFLHNEFVMSSKQMYAECRLMESAFSKGGATCFLQRIT